MQNTIFHRPALNVFSLILLSCFLLIIESGCMSSTRLRVLKPAAFTIPEHIQTVATVNRSIPTKKVGSTIEGILTGEGLFQDRDGANAAIEGLSEALMRTPRFKVVHTNIEMEGGAIHKFPMPLDWADVEKICQDYKTDALVALETYDSDTHESCSKSISKRKDKEGKEYEVVSWNSDMHTNVRLGWRLYDPKNRTIMDQFGVDERKGWSGEGSTESDALNDLPGKRFTVNQTSHAAGHKYGRRIAPSWVFLERSYYKKHKKEADMKQAFQLAKIDKWKEAAEIWNRLYNSGDQKLKRKTAFNMALACEVEGQLNTAVEWASQAYQDGNKKGRSYAAALKQRIREHQEVQRQMNAKKKAKVKRYGE